MTAQVLESVCGSLPERSTRALGRRIGEGCYGVFKVRRSTVESQIAAAFPEKPPGWVRATALGCYRHFGEELCATLRVARRGVRTLLDRVENPGEVLALFRDTVPAGSGAVVVSGHLGNWELAGAYLTAIGLPVTTVANRQRGALGRRVHGLRDALGIHSTFLDESPRAVGHAVSAGRIVGLVADQHAASGGVTIPFLGRPASTHRGPARLALRFGVPLFFGALVREGAGYRALFRVIAPVDGCVEPELALTEGWVAHLEEEVRRRPTQYYWFHRRWKTADPGTGAGPHGRIGRDVARPEENRTMVPRT